MSFSINWPVMPRIGAVSIHSVGNQNYQTGFDVQYMGPKGRVTLYVNHYLTEDLQLVFRQRHTHQYSYSPGYLIGGDGYEAELAVRQFVEADGLIDGSKDQRVTDPGIRSCFEGAVAVELKENEQVLNDLRRFQKLNGDNPKASEAAGFGLSFAELTAKEICVIEDRQIALQGVLKTLRELGRQKLSSSAIAEAIKRPDLKTEFVGFESSPLISSEEIVERFRLYGSGRYIQAAASGLYHNRIYGEPLGLSLRLTPRDPAFKVGFGLKADDILDDDLLVMSGPSNVRVLERDMAAFQAIKSNPRLIIFSNNGLLEGRLADFTPTMFSPPESALTI